jgi:methyltransferase (TIGR00027 family)
MGMQHSRGGDPKMPTGVSMTALGVAAARATESARPDRLFEDSLANKFIAAAGADFEEMLPCGSDLDATLARFFDYAALRTRFFDDYLLAACAAGCRQVVVLAAGLDTRAFRLPWPEVVRLFELDLAQIFVFKEQVLAREGARPVCQRIVVEADLSEEWSAPLLQASFSPDERTAWLAEGILPYLTEEENDRVMSSIGQLSTFGSQLAFEHMKRDAQESVFFRDAAAALAELGVSWQSLLGSPDAWLADYGWQGQVFDSADLASSYRRPSPAYEEFTEEDANIAWLVRAVRNPT